VTLDRPAPPPGGDLTLRNADLNTLFDMLTEQAAKAVDVVVPAAQLRADAARLSIPQTVPHIDEDGVTMLDGLYIPTRYAESQIANKLKIPLEYLRRLRADAPGLWEANVGHWLADAGDSGKSFLLRLLVDPARGGGVLRALLSSRYGIIDNLDVLLCALDGIRAAGVDVEVTSCDLSETRMYVTVVAPQIAVAAPGLLAGYRSPFTGAEGAANPVMWGGLVITNSETGGGAATITPRLVVRICRNGMTITADAHRAVHLGGKLAEGVIDWSADTQAKSLQLITAKARDAVTRFLDPRYVTRVIEGMERDAGAPVERPQEAIALVSQQLRFSDEQQDAILAHFIKGGSLTAGGVMHAVTSVAQTLDDADAAHDMESRAVKALQLAAAR